MTISTSTLVVASPDLTVADLGDEAVILDPSTGKYFGLNTVATRILAHAADPISIEDLVGRLLSEFEVSADVLSRDVTAFVADLTQRGILIAR